jgi:hypothetical protein
MKIMVNDSSASVREETPHLINNIVLSKSLRRRAQSIIDDRSIDSETRASIRYALTFNDPWLPELVRRVDAGEPIIDLIDSSQMPPTYEETLEDKIEELAEIICGDDEEGTKWGALFVLLATLEDTPHPKVLANAAKHFAFARCGELNLYGMINDQIERIERELLIVPFE